MSRNYNGFLFAREYLQGGTSLFQFSCDGWLDERNHRPGVLRPPTRFRRPTAPERPPPIPLFDRKRPSLRPELPSGRAPRTWGDKALVGNRGFRRYLKPVSAEHFAVDETRVAE